MAQNRKPPAYQEYASAMLANIALGSMSMEERGLLYTMRLECWVNCELPSDSEPLSSVLGKIVTPIMLKALESFFKIENGLITCPELDDYRAHLAERRDKQSAGGKKGATATNSKKKVTGNPQVPRRGSGESLVQSSKTKQSQTESIEAKNFNYCNKDGSDPLSAELHEVPSACAKCNGEGCEWCDKK